MIHQCGRGKPVQIIGAERSERAHGFDNVYFLYLSVVYYYVVNV
jgi:hypothetical protein